MRRGNNSAWMEDDNKQMIAINLGADYTAEHEWGVKDLYQTLGVDNDEKVLGMDRYRVKNPKMENLLFLEEDKNNAVLLCLRYQSDIEHYASRKLDTLGELRLYDNDLATAWDGKSFGIRVKRPVNIKRLKRIQKAIENKDAAVWLGGGHVFQNAGLVIGIISAIPQNLKDQMYNAHVDSAKLKEASDKTGIKAKIDAINDDFKEKHKGNFHAMFETPCGYHALSPAWLSKDRKSNYPVQYWLNPQQQHKNECGWYTVEELLDWVEGRENKITKKQS